MTEQNPPLDLQASGIKHPANLFRRALLGIVGAEGVSSLNGANDLKATQNSTPGLSVWVAKGGCLVKGDDSGDQGLYYCYNDATVQKTVPTPDATNPRKDIVVARVKDGTEGQAGDTWLIDYIAGAPAASPVAPTVPATALLLATVDVAALASSIVNANIADNRAKHPSGVDASGLFQVQAMTDVTNHGLGASEVTVYSFTAGLPTGWAAMDIYVIGFLEDTYVNGSGFRRVFGQCKLDGTAAPYTDENYFDTDFGATTLARDLSMFNSAIGKTASVAVVATNWESGGGNVSATGIFLLALKIRRPA